MPYVQIPRDITKVKSKVALGMTKRQLICLASAVLIGFPVFWILKSWVSIDLSLYVMMAIIMPIGLLAFYSKDGMPLEKYLILLIKWRLSPRTRSYQTDNLYKQLDAQIAIEKEIKRYVYLNSKKQKTRKAIKNRPKQGTHERAKKENSSHDENGKKNR